MGSIVTLGEMLLRLKSQDNLRLFQTNKLESTFGGGEVNMAVSLSLLGASTRFVTALPDNIIGDSCINELHKYQIDTTSIVRTGKRVGIYYLEAGANQRATKVIYDRQDSSISHVTHDVFNWDAVFQNASWFIISGITPALSESAAELTVKAVDEAKSRGIHVCLDFNHRKNLWNYGKNIEEVMRPLVKKVNVIIAGTLDCQQTLGVPLDSGRIKGDLNMEELKQLTSKVMATYDLSGIAITKRDNVSANINNWTAFYNCDEGFYTSTEYRINNIVDRVGGGDSFTAGLIYGLNYLNSPKEALDFATAFSCLKLSCMGDFNLTTRDDVLALISGDISGRILR
ncbi:sugar kinase [Spirochaeta cellobiosiphila]|uniref:sugar kinase n=1 Tax=Spirochaeta cellobiosiphila TaxID=504483 RepID=UPI0004255F4F|nr:sugar kinase [Spirochaeta cellobiosiphila]